MQRAEIQAKCTFSLCHVT